VALGALGTALVAVALVVLLAGSATHPLRALFTAALQLRPGNEVRIAGRTVGAVESISLDDGEALVTMGIDDADWPLTAGTTATLRVGGAASYASRYVQLMPPPPTQPTSPNLPDDALLPISDTVTPVEFDQIFSTFDAPARAHLGGTLAHAAQTLNGQASTISRDLKLGGPGVQRTADLLGDLGIDPTALSELVTAGASTFSALRSRDAQLQGLVGGAAQTFSVFADNAGALSATLTKLPGTLSTSQATLAQLDTSLTGLGTLVDDIRPGAAGLATDAPLLETTLARVLQVGPAAISTLRTGTRTLPQLTRLLSVTMPFAPKLSHALAALAPMIACIRPYTPEIGGYLETWQGGPYDNVGHFGRVDFIQTPIMPGTTMTSAQAVASSGGTLHYAFPRPPGLNAGQPWFQPQCGAGPDSLIAADDPEAEK
jgi:phospholipid/cholesterol/gamma-HCH transport system substrate-binding protein